MEEIGSGKLIKFGGGALAVLGVLLGMIGTTSMGLFVLYAVMFVVGAAMVKIGDRIDQQQAESRARARGAREKS